MAPGAIDRARLRVKGTARDVRARVIEAAVADATRGLREDVLAARAGIQSLNDELGAARAAMSQLSAEVASLRGDLLSRLETTLLSETQLIRQQLRYLGHAHLGTEGLVDERDLGRYEMPVLSQNGEDGVLVEIFRRIGTESKRFVEIGAHHAEAICLVLADLLGWRGTFIDASETQADLFRRKYSGLDTVSIVDAFVSRDNINELLEKAGAPEGIDVFALDIDGNDYWVWEALSVASPRVVVIEYNSSIDQSQALVQPYAPASAWDGTAYFGASLEAVRQLGKRKGYALVHADISGVNAFFVRDDLHQGRFPSEDAVLRRPTSYYLAGVMHRPIGEGRAFVNPAGTV